MQKQKAHSVTIGAKELPVFSFVNMRARWQKFLVAELKWNIWKKKKQDQLPDTWQLAWYENQLIS